MSYDICIGNLESEHVLMCLNPQDTERTWFIGDVEIRVEGFVGKFIAYFEVRDFSNFANELTKSHSSLNGSATLLPRDKQLVLTFKGNGRGGINVEGEAYSRACYRINWNLLLKLTKLFF